MNTHRRIAAYRTRVAIAGAAVLGGAVLPAVGLGATSAFAGPSCPVSAGTVTCTYNTPGAATFAVPAGVTSLTVTADGASGADTGMYDGGLGGEAQATLTGAGLTGSALDVYIGMSGSLGGGGANSGGNGGAGLAAGGGGGSGSTVSVGAQVLVAGGGGGGAAANNGGNGGTSANTMGADGAPGYGVAVPGGQGGTVSAGGAGGTTGGAGDCSSATAGGALAGGNGATGGETCVGGGGGGGGYYGGGGGGDLALVSGGGGGGSAFPAAATTISGIAVAPNTGDSNTHAGDGLVTISYPQTSTRHTHLSASVYFNARGTFTVAATLTSLGSPVMGQSVSFDTGSHVLCMATTNARGVARCKLTGWQTLLVEVNAFTITADFSGNTGYYPSFATAHFCWFP